MQVGSWVQNLAFPPASSTSQFIFGVPGQVKHFSFGPQMGQSLCKMATGHAYTKWDAKMLANMLTYKKVKNLATMDLTKLAEHVD